MSGGNVGISIKHHALIDAIEVNSKTNVESAVDLNGLTFTQDQGVDFHAKANRIKHELTKIHRREGFGQHYQYDEQNQRALISKIDVKPSPEKINCHFTAYALQGLSVLCGAQDLLNMAAIEDFQSQEYRDKLQDLWNNFVDDMKKMGDSPETATHESFNRRLAAFNFKIVGTLSVCPGFEAKVSAWTGKSRNIRTQIHGLLEKARLWTQLRFKPTTFVYREVEDDGKVHYTVREPILAKNSGSSLVTSVAKQGSVNRVFFNHHQDVFRQGALVPTQLTDQSSGLIAPRNSWLVTNMERETGVEDAQVKMTSQIATSGVYGFMSSENVQIVHGQVEAGLKALSQEEPSSVVDQRETKKPNSLVTQGSHSRRHTNIKFKKTEATPPEVTTPAMQVVPLSLVTDSVLRGGNTPGKGGGEKGAVQSYQAQHEQSLNFNYVLAPLFQRRALSATVEDTSTKAVIDKILEKLPRSSGGSWSNAFKKFMQTDFDLWGDYPVDDPVELYQAAKRYVDAERDPSRKKTLQALLAWKVLEINQNNKGREPFVTVFDDVLGYAGMSDRPVYHLWQSALSVIIHHSQNVFLQAQCKSGKDRTGLLVVAHQILDRLYTPDDGFTYALSKEETPVLSKELKNVQEGSSTESPRRGSVEYRKNKVGLFERIRDRVINQGDAQLAASEGGTLGCVGIMSNGTTKGIGARIFGLSKNSKESNSLISKQANGRKALKLSRANAALLDKIDALGKFIKGEYNLKLLNEDPVFKKSLTQHRSLFGVGQSQTGKYIDRLVTNAKTPRTTEAFMARRGLSKVYEILLDKAASRKLMSENEAHERKSFAQVNCQPKSSATPFRNQNDHSVDQSNRSGLDGDPNINLS